MKKILLALTLFFVQPCLASPEGAKAMEDKISRFYDNQDRLTEDVRAPNVKAYTPKYRFFILEMVKQSFDLILEVSISAELSPDEKIKCIKRIKDRKVAIQTRLIDQLEGMLN